VVRNGGTSFFYLLKTITFSALLWLYAGVLLFVWFFARLISEDAVVISIGTSFFSDLAWVPLGMVVWTGMFAWFAKITAWKRQKSNFYILHSAAIIAAVVFVIVFPDTAFRFLFIPLIVSVVQVLTGLYKRRDKFILYLLYVPSIIIISTAIAYFGWQMVPFFAGQSEIYAKVMTYNIMGDSNIQNRIKVIETIRREQPDIVCCTEYNPWKDHKVFTDKLADLYPYIISNRNDKSRRHGELILSRYPVTLKYIADFDTFNVMFAELIIMERKVNLVNVHLPHVVNLTNDIKDSTLTVVENLYAISELGTLQDNRKFREAKSIFSYITKFHDPTIICGDLNSTPNCRVYHLFADRYCNAFSSKGWGLGDTFGESWVKEKTEHLPFAALFARDFIRIDHIFVSEHFDVISSRVLKNAQGSDHKPLIAVVRLKSK